MNHDERLGVLPGTSAAERRAAYRRLAQELHPDHGRAALDEMAALNDAYAILRDPDRRAAYDRSLGAVDPVTRLSSSHENMGGLREVAGD